MLPDPSALDMAVVTRLQDDAVLKAAMPDGVYIDIAPPNSQRFVIVSLVIAEDRPAFEGRAVEDVLYLIKAVALSTANADIKTAAARIDALFEDLPLPVAGYTWMTCHREERVRYTEVDSVDTSLRWYHRGGRYRVQMALIHT